MFYQCVPIYHFTNVPGPFSQSSSLSEYNVACNVGTVPAHFRVLNNWLLNKDLYVVPEQAPIVLLDSKAAVCMYNNGKGTRHISR